MVGGDSFTMMIAGLAVAAGLQARPPSSWLAPWLDVLPAPTPEQASGNLDQARDVVIG
jgi:hypothetical protein